VYKGTPIRQSADFSAEILQTRREWHNTFKVMKEQNPLPRIFNPARLSFIWDFLCFLDLDVCFISEVRKVVSQLFLQISCLSFILSLFLLKPYNVDVSMLDVVSEVS